VLTTYTAQGLIASMTLVDEVESVEVSADATLSKDVKHMAFELGFAADAGPMPVMVSATIGLHQPPTK
jgi:hypothetical protein